MLHPSRLASLAELNVRVMHAESVVARHKRLVAQAGRGSDEARNATALLRVAEEKLTRLDRSRDVLLGDDEGVEEFEEDERG